VLVAEGRYTAAGQPRGPSTPAAAGMAAAAAGGGCAVPSTAAAPAPAAGPPPPAPPAAAAAASRAAPAPPSHSAASNTAGPASSSRQCQAVHSTTPQPLPIPVLHTPSPPRCSSRCQAWGLMQCGGLNRRCRGAVPGVWVPGAVVRASPMTSHSRAVTPLAPCVAEDTMILWGRKRERQGGGRAQHTSQG
jgi:hypothetical protein